MFGKTKKTAIVLIFAVLILAGCSGDKNPSVYAVVDGVEITRADFDRYVNFLWFNPEIELTEEQKTQVLEEMIQLQVYTTGARARGIEPDRDDAVTEYESFRDQLIAGDLFTGNATAYYARMQELGLDEEWVISVFEQFQVYNALVDAEQEIEPSDSEIEAYYDKQKEALFGHGELRRVRHILINEENFPDADESEVDELSETLAQEVYQRLVAGEEYADLAPEYSQDGSAENGGDIGFIEQSDVVKEFGDVAFATELDVVAEPVESQYGWHILEVTEIKEPGYYELDDDIREWIASTLQKERATKLLSDLMEEAEIVNNLK